MQGIVCAKHYSVKAYFLWNLAPLPPPPHHPLQKKKNKNKKNTHTQNLHAVVAFPNTIIRPYNKIIHLRAQIHWENLLEGLYFANFVVLG